MPLKPEEARQAAIRQLRERLNQTVPQNVTISDIEIVSSDRKDVTHRLYNKITHVRKPCDLVWEHWIVRSSIQYKIQYKATLPNGAVYLIETQSRWFRIEEWDIFTYLDCKGAEDLPPIPENYCSFTQDGVQAWKGNSATLHGGQMSWPDEMGWAMEIGYNDDDFPEQDMEQQKI